MYTREFIRVMILSYLLLLVLGIDIIYAAKTPFFMGLALGCVCILVISISLLIQEIK